MSNTDFDPRDFRRALSQFPTGVTVITTLDENAKPVGVTASSFNSVSMNPPLILWSIDKTALSLEIFQNAEYFAVNILGRDQVDTSNNFASRGDDKFANASFSTGLGGSPLLNDYAAQLECKTWASYDGGDHMILVGEVIDYRYNDNTQPLVFARGSYAISAQHPEVVKSSVSYKNTPTEGDFVNDYLLYLLRVSYQGFSAHLYPKLKKELGINPEEWRILARLINFPVIKISELASMVMQPKESLRYTADWMAEKALVELLDADTIKVTPQGSEIGGKMQALAIEEETALLSQIPADQVVQLKTNLKSIIDKLG